VRILVERRQEHRRVQTRIEQNMYIAKIELQQIENIGRRSKLQSLLQLRSDALFQSTILAMLQNN
jgi:hypothetical protein